MLVFKIRLDSFENFIDVSNNYKKEFAHHIILPFFQLNIKEGIK